VRALVFERPGVDDARVVEASIPPPSAIDYYGRLEPGERPPRTGATAVFGFRMQAFVTRAYVACVTGIAGGRPRVSGISKADGTEVRWP
jgi:YhfX-like protein